MKGAHPVHSIAFLISSTNLVIELGIVLLVLLGWKFMVANFMLGILMTIYAYALTLIWFPRSLVESAKECVFRGHPATHSDHIRPPVPTHSATCAALP